ncbi:hypothetical protein [Clostridium botulinum]|uniref:Uncharacterized protein n=1 Tax=Clostridium botulinum (strain Langeland / NCTC 10281 / Type F) TaxID=441772 RepID=A7GAS4_CLOBL|nr:hypothetical protein [Clostridium botulinum]ABS39886.1 hypothetical protein CLI_0599 [Clostridium botulinum F str. Langeland]KKM40414.1 hypothetical protein VT72_14965 [Clostridium botulinum]MBY6793346.1 hypothetical protein [Clostridium botulinum]MBY6939089.1 hypothetical protein [Clostridium botulinum]MBY6943045.1 hypothetical protein [Clostridium botulinum]
MDKYKKIILKDAIKNIKSAKESLSYTKDIKKDNLEGSIINFRNGKDFNTILDIETNLGKIKFPGWITLKESKNLDPSYSEHSIATWIKEKNFLDNYRYIVFENPICSFSLTYFSFFPVKITALDSKENVLKVIEGEKNWCDEKGYSNLSELNIDVENNIIKYIKVESFAEYIGMDSLKTYKRIHTKIPDKNNSYKAHNDFDTFFIALCIYLLFFHRENNNHYYKKNKYRKK